MGHCIDFSSKTNLDGAARLHRFRYYLARGFIQAGDTVKDVGSGAGYGCDMYSDIASKVTGIELEQDEVDAAKAKYPLVEFLCDNLEKMELPLTDVSSGFEIIEHLYSPNEFIQKLKSSTKKFILFSVPVGQKIIMVDGDPQEEHDSTHHSAFVNGDEIMGMFVDNEWTEFFRLQLGVTFIGIVYNPNNL